MTDPELIDYFAIVKPSDGGWFIDIGAYKGDISKKAMSVAKDLKVVLIEPNPIYFKEIKRSFYPQNYVFNFALGDRVGNAHLKSGDSLIPDYPIGVRYNRSIPVKMTTLDKVLETLGDPVPDFIKIDTEGSEAYIIRGYTKIHSGTKFHIEYHFNLGEILLEMFKKKIKPLAIEIWRRHEGRTGVIHAIAE